MLPIKNEKRLRWRVQISQNPASHLFVHFFCQLKFFSLILIQFVSISNINFCNGFFFDNTVNCGLSSASLQYQFFRNSVVTDIRKISYPWNSCHPLAAFFWLFLSWIVHYIFWQIILWICSCFFFFQNIYLSPSHPQSGLPL